MFRFLCLFLCISLYGEPVYLEFNDYVGKEEFQEAKGKLTGEEVIIAIHSTSADINGALDFAKALYHYKSRGKVVVYINQTALGPTAIIPFLADELDTSFFVSWGDIPLGEEGTVPVNILVNQLKSLISPNLVEIAEAMSDKTAPNYRGWKLPDQTLVLNQTEMSELNLVKKILEPDVFLKPFPQKKVVKEENEFAQHIHYNDSANTIGHILIDDRTNGINQSTWIYVKNALDYYKTRKPAFIILELNTPGGEVFAAQKISDALKELDTQYNIPVVAYINNWAISAGAMLAYSCRYITTVKDGSMGAAEPVLEGEGGKMETASEKVNSAIRSDFASRASFFGRNPLIAEKMVDKDLILVLRHGKITKLDQESQIKLTGPDPDEIISAKGKLLTLNGPQMVKYGVANLLLEPAKREALTPQEADLGVYPAAKSLLFTAPFFNQIPNATIDTYKMDWKTKFFVLLAHPVVSSVLFLGLMMGLYLEFSNPGFGLPATVAITCLILIGLSSYSQEIGSSLEAILLLIGLGIILVDFFVFPTFGLFGIIGSIFFIAGLFGLMLPGLGNIHYEFDTHTLNAAGEAFFSHLIWLLATFVIGLFLIAILARFVAPRFSGFKRFVLEGHEQTGYTSGDLPESFPKPGMRGKAITPLRPAGKIEVEGKLYDALSSGQFINSGDSVEVLRIEGNQVIVKI